MAKNTPTVAPTEALFDAWGVLANAAHDYSNDSSEENAKALRKAARDYAFTAEDLET